jgi:hypothetical protein
MVILSHEMAAIRERNLVVVRRITSRPLGADHEEVDET